MRQDKGEERLEMHPKNFSRLWLERRDNNLSIRTGLFPGGDGPVLWFVRVATHGWPSIVRTDGDWRRNELLYITLF